MRDINDIIDDAIERLADDRVDSGVEDLYELAQEFKQLGMGKQFFYNDDIYFSTAWTKCATTLTPTWSGTLSAARVKFTCGSGTYDMFIDDAVLSVADSDPAPDSEPTVAVVPGTWRREVIP